MSKHIKFTDAPTISAYLTSDANVRLITGPRESGKTVGSAAGLYSMMCTMPRSVDGYRRSRFLIARPTYGELERGTMKTWLDWFDEDTYGPKTGSGPYVQKIEFLDVKSEIVFMAIGSVDDLAKLRSQEFTAAWYNEGQFAPLRVITEMLDITGRYPKKATCPRYDRKKTLFLDANAPESDLHWMWLMSGKTPMPRDMPEDQKLAYRKPEGWEFFWQPPALLEDYDEDGNLLGYRLNPKAENLVNHGSDPYGTATDGKNRDEITRDFLVRPSASKDGKPRYPKFDPTWNVSKDELIPYEGAPVIVSIDPGSAASGAVFEQNIDGRWFTYRELIGEGVGMDEFAPAILEVLTNYFPFWREAGLVGWIDPFGGWDGGGATSTTSKDILLGHGIMVNSPAPKDDPQFRMEIGRRVLHASAPNNPRKPKCLIDGVNCPRLVEALDGGAKLIQSKSGGVEVVKWKMKKDHHSHITEAWEYSKWGGGEGDSILLGEGIEDMIANQNRKKDSRDHSSRRRTGDDIFRFRNVRSGGGRRFG